MMIKVMMVMVTCLDFDSGSHIRFVILHHVFIPKWIHFFFIYEPEIIIVTTSNVVIRSKFIHIKYVAHSKCSGNKTCCGQWESKQSRPGVYP